MKKLISILFFVFLYFIGISQTQPGFPTGLQVQGIAASTNTLWIKNFPSANGYAWYADFADTTEANTNAFYKQIAGMTVRTGDTLWIRNSLKTRWNKFGGGATYFDTTASIRPGGSGTISDPKTMDLIVSPNAGNQIVVLPNGVYSTTAAQVQNGLISGGIVIWETGLTYTVTAATYAIGGVIYTSPETSITLDNADPTNNRIDAFVVTTSSTAIDLTGTPSTDPQNPSYTATTQLPLTFVLVTAASTEPTYCRDSIYFPNNGQNWTMTVSNTGRVNTTSTNNPYSVTQDVEFTAAINTDQLRAAKGSAISFSTYSVMVLKIRSKAAWASTSTISIQAYNGITPLGTAVYIGDNTPYAFNSSNAATYQTVVIPIGNLGVTTGATDLLLTVNTISGNTIGFYLDNWELLGCNGAPIPTSGSFWSVNGNSQGTVLYGGTRDNFPVQMVTNNANALNISTSGHLTLQKTNPFISFFLGSGASADYFIQRNANTLIFNTAGVINQRLAGNNVYTYDGTNGHIWLSPVAAQQMRLLTTGQLRLNLYGSNTFTGTPTRWLAVDVNGNVIEQAAPLTAVTADNGITANTSTNVRLGGTLIQTTNIATAGFQTVFTDNVGSAISLLDIISNAGAAGISVTSTGSGINILSATNTGLQVNTASTGINSFGTSVGVVGSSTTGEPVRARNNSNTAAGVFDGLTLSRTGSSLAGIVGTGIQTRFEIRNDAVAIKSVALNVVKFTDATSGSEDATMEWYLMTAGAAAARKMALTSLGDLTLDGYGAGSITGTPTFNLAVTSAGKIIEVAAGTGMTNPMTTTGDIIYSSDNSGTPARLAAGTAGFVLTSNGAGAAPSWQSVVGTGTVTSVGWTGGIVSIATATTTPAFTIAGTSGGIPYFSSSSTWATSAVLAANAIVLGGGAGTAPATTTTAAGIVTWIGTPSSANLITAMTDETGTGALVFATSPTLVTPALGTPVSGVISTGVTLGDVTMNVTGTDATGDIYYRSAGGILTRLAIGTSGQVLRTSAGGLPEWFTTAGSGTVTSITLTQPSAGITITNSGVAATGIGTFTFALAGDLAAVEGLATTGIVRRTGTNTWTAGTLVGLTTEVTGTLPVGNGGTGFASGYTAGQILWANSATTLTRGFLLGTANQINVSSVAGGITLSMAFNPTEQTLTDGATVTWNVTNGGNAVWTNNGTGRTLTLSNVIAGYSYTLRLIQGAGGSKTVTTWTNVRWANATPPTLSTTAGQTDMVTLYCVNSTYLVGYFTPNVQ